MTTMSKEKLQEGADIFKALAHPSRLLIIQTLAQGKMCVNDLTALIGADTSTVSRHLAQLRNVGLIQCKKQGLQVFYELHCPCIIRFLDCIESVAVQPHATVCACC